jgi:hypothetical protein
MAGLVPVLVMAPPTTLPSPWILMTQRRSRCWWCWVKPKSADSDGPSNAADVFSVVSRSSVAARPPSEARHRSCALQGESGQLPVSEGAPWRHHPRFAVATSSHGSVSSKPKGQLLNDGAAGRRRVALRARGGDGACPFVGMKLRGYRRARTSAQAGDALGARLLHRRNAIRRCGSVADAGTLVEPLLVHRRRDSVHPKVRPHVARRFVKR